MLSNWYSPAFFMALFFIAFSAMADKYTGPLAVVEKEYRYPAEKDPQVQPDPIYTEVWAQVYRPSVLENKAYPLVILLHGNHNTCGKGVNPRIDDDSTYSNTGKCPVGYVEVHHHKGFAYLAKRLASWGYIVASINTNRGITGNLNFSCPPTDSQCLHARSRMVLKHLALWYQWHSVGNTPATLGVGATGFKGKIDFSKVGLMGHSRGGEGVRIVPYRYGQDGGIWKAKIPGLVIKAIFEIAPTDILYDSPLDPLGVTWATVLPLCDWDIQNYEGNYPYNRMMNAFKEPVGRTKSTFMVYGAMHNFYNTEWQTADSMGNFMECPNALFPKVNPTMGSVSQQFTAISSFIPFMRKNLPVANAGVIHNHNFNNPLYPLDPEVAATTIIEREYTETPRPEVTQVLEDFVMVSNMGQYYVPHKSSASVTVVHGPFEFHDKAQRTGKVKWSAPGYLQLNRHPAKYSGDFSPYKTLDFRITRSKSTINSWVNTDMSIQLVRVVNGQDVLSSPVALSSILKLRAPYKQVHMQTARIPLTYFGGDLKSIRGVRFNFDKTTAGEVYIANIRLSTIGYNQVIFNPLPSAEVPVPMALLKAPGTTLSAAPKRGKGSYETLGEEAYNIGGKTYRVMELKVKLEGQVFSTGAQEAVEIGGKKFSWFGPVAADAGDGTFVVRIPIDEYSDLAEGDPILYRQGSGETRVWELGNFQR